MEFPFPEVGKTLGGFGDRENGNQMFAFETVEFEMLSRHLSGDTEEADRFMSLEFRE